MKKVSTAAAQERGSSVLIRVAKWAANGAIPAVLVRLAPHPLHLR